MFNPIAFKNFDSIPAGTATYTIGFGPGQATPALLLESLVTGNLTINLPPISGYVPQPPTTTAQVQGVAGGYRMTIFNTGGGTITITPYNTSPETDISLPSTITVSASANAKVTIQSVNENNTWYVVA